MNTSKRKGDRAELEVQEMLRLELGVPARRALGAGRLDDIGDIHGVPDTVIQVANWKNVAAALREKPLECAEQVRRFRDVRSRTMGLPIDVLGATFIRMRSSRIPTEETDYPNWRVAQTIEQWCKMWMTR